MSYKKYIIISNKMKCLTLLYRLNIFVFNHFTLQITIWIRRIFAFFVSNNNELLIVQKYPIIEKYHSYLFMFFQIAEPRERSVAELAWVRSSGVIAIGIDADVDINLGFRWEAGWCRRCAGGRRLAAATRVGPAILTMPRGTSGS